MPLTIIIIINMKKYNCLEFRPLLCLCKLSSLLAHKGTDWWCIVDRSRPRRATVCETFSSDRLLLLMGIVLTRAAHGEQHANGRSWRPQGAHPLAAVSDFASGAAFHRQLSSILESHRLRHWHIHQPVHLRYYLPIDRAQHQSESYLCLAR